MDEVKVSGDERKVVELRIEESQPKLRMEGNLPKRHIDYNLNGSKTNSPKECHIVKMVTK